jgi:V/A-type H+-transporting ATPase subunit A
LERLYADGGRPHAELELVGVNTSNYFGRAAPETMSAQTFRKFVAVLGLAELEESAARLSSVFHDRIEEIRVIEGRSPVYDVTVPGAHNFVGGFGPMILHNTVLQHQLSRWADADLIIFIGCGERGNEMTDVLTEFPKLEDPRSGRPLMERTILIANTSNMPVTARETSIYTGVTIAEYFRNMGYDVALMADSTSRWAEAVREIAGRMEEMPVEEGFPSHLPARLAEFYERAGYGKVSRDRYGSITIIGAVSPPGGDFTEPVTMNTKRFIRTFWALDKRLAFARHFPAISWIETYSEYIEEMAEWWQREKKIDWKGLRQEALAILSRENELQKIVQIIGPDALPDDQRLILHIAALIKEGFLQQNAMDDIDRYSTPEKEIRMLEILMRYRERAERLLKLGVPLYRIQKMKVNLKLLTMKHEVPNDQLEELEEIEREMDREFEGIEQEHGALVR